MSEKVIQIRLAIRDRGVKKEFEEIIASTDGCEIQRVGDQHRPDLLIIDVGNDIEKEFGVIESLLNSDSVGEVFLTSRNTDESVLLKAMRIGAKEFFSQPLKEQEIRQALSKLKARKEKSGHQNTVKSGQIIDVIGSKGGVGATTVAVNVAASIAENKDAPSVALVDMNTLFGQIPLFLSLKPNYHWGEIVKDIDRLDATFLMKVLSPHSSGIHVLSSPGFLNGNRPATPETIESILNLMQSMFDFVIIDGGQALNKTSQRVLEMSNSVLLISLLSLPYLSNTSKLLASFDHSSYVSKECVRVIINRYLRKPEISLKDAEEAIDERIFWTVPNDYKTTMSAINQGKPLSQIASRASITKSIKGLAAALLPNDEKQDKRRWKFLKR